MRIIMIGTPEVTVMLSGFTARMSDQPPHTAFTSAHEFDGAAFQQALIALFSTVLASAPK